MRANMIAYSVPSPFPPSYEGEPLSYLFGLFGDLVATGIALAVLLTITLESRRRAAVANNPPKGVLSFIEPPFLSVLRVQRWYEIGLLLFVIMRTLPDALWMLLWGGVEEDMIRMLLRFDVLADGFALVPLTFAIICWAWSRQAVRQKLYDVHDPQLPPLGLPLIWRNLRIVPLALIIAAGVTIGKASM